VIPASITAQDFMSFGAALSKIRQISYQQCLKERHSHSAPSQNPHISTQRPRALDNKGMPDPGTNELSCDELI
jgi:hypothetical protein